MCNHCWFSDCCISGALRCSILLEKWYSENLSIFLWETGIVISCRDTAARVSTNWEKTLNFGNVYRKTPEKLLATYHWLIMDKKKSAIFWCQNHSNITALDGEVMAQARKGSSLPEASYWGSFQQEQPPSEEESNQLLETREAPGTRRSHLWAIWGLSAFLA